MISLGSQESSEFDESVGGYEVFQRRAKSERGIFDATWRVGFDPKYRQDSESHVVDSIFAQMIAVSSLPMEEVSNLLDIGSGSSPLTDSITAKCSQLGMRHVVVDSPEMLRHLEKSPNRFEVPGRFPWNLNDITRIAPKFNYIIAYSVLQYVHREADSWDFIWQICELLPPGGVALIGDLPNRDQRDRQIAASGLSIPDPSISELRDDVLLEIMARVRKARLNAYLIPQYASELMRLHRENLLITRPLPY